MTSDWVRLVGPKQSLEVLGVRLVGANVETAKKLLFTVVLVTVLLLLHSSLRAIARLLLRRHPDDRRLAFWTRQGLNLFFAAALGVGLVSVWFNDPGRLATFLGLVTAGLAFALQRAITALAGYLVILRGKTFNVGDRITMGGVRGDVIALGFMQTTIMEMGQPPDVQAADPAMWVRARQYTGRIVTVTNDKVFQEPVYNYTGDFPYLWEELRIPIRYTADRARAEEILLQAARRNTLALTEVSEQAVREMERRYSMRRPDMVPRVYYRLTDNWLELTVRFISLDYGVRDVKDRMCREVLDALEASGIELASATHELVALPPVRVRLEAPTASAPAPSPQPAGAEGPG